MFIEFTRDCQRIRKFYCLGKRCVREVLIRKKKKSVKFHTQGGGQDKIGSFSHFFYFFFFHVLNHGNLQRKIFLYVGGGYPLPGSPKILDILGKIPEIFLSFMDL